MSELRERYRLDLEALPAAGAPAVIRLRRFLKAALRSYGLKCIRAVALPNDSVVATADPVPMEGEHVEI